MEYSTVNTDSDEEQIGYLISISMWLINRKPTTKSERPVPGLRYIYLGCMNTVWEKERHTPKLSTNEVVEILFIPNRAT